MRDDVRVWALSLIGWAHARNDPWYGTMPIYGTGGHYLWFYNDVMFPALLTLGAGNPSVTDGFPHEMQLMQSFGVRLAWTNYSTNVRSSWRIEKPWRSYDVTVMRIMQECNGDVIHVIHLKCDYGFVVVSFVFVIWSGAPFTNMV